MQSNPYDLFLEFMKSNGYGRPAIFTHENVEPPLYCFPSLSGDGKRFTFFLPIGLSDPEEFILQDLAGISYYISLHEDPKSWKAILFSSVD